MARPLRIEYEGAFYHVTSRGNDRKRIYFVKADYGKFKSYLQEAQEKYRYILHGYVLMPNHYHLLVETPNANISKVMHYLNGSYTNYVNWKHKRSGHLFQGRYKAIVVDRDSYLMELSRYLHLNPVRAKMVSKPEDYPYSSYRSYIYRRNDRIVQRDLILGMLSEDHRAASRRYRDFVGKAIGEDFENPLEQVYGGMILGGQQFVKEALGRLEEEVLQRNDVSYRRELQGAIRSDAVIEAVCSYFRVSRDEVMQDNNECRKIAIYLMKKFTGLTNREVGELFGNISYSAVSKTCKRFSERLRIDKTLRNQVGQMKTLLSNVKG